MARNVEIKARIESVESFTPRAVALADHGPIEIVQDDTFVLCGSGRLKLRSLSPRAGELIFHRRPDQSGPCEDDHAKEQTHELRPPALSRSR